MSGATRRDIACGALASGALASGALASGALASGALAWSRRLSLRGDTLWNGVGALIPALAAIWVVPGLSQALGPEGFALLSIAWALVGWLSLADLGLSRAVTRGVALALTANNPGRAAALTWTATWYMTWAAVAVALLLWVAAPWVVTLLQVPVPEQPAVRTALRWTAVALVPTVGMAGWRGVLEGCRAFRTVALLRIPFGVAFAVAPWAMAQGGLGLVGALQGIAVVRLLAWVAHGVAAVRQLPALRTPAPADASDRRALLAFGGWSTVGNLVSPLMNTVDRLGLGALMPLALLAPYAVAIELGTKAWLLAAIVVPVYFPRFAQAIAATPPEAVRQLRQGVWLLARLVIPGLMLVAAGAPWALEWWMGPPLAADAARALQWMCVGLAPNLVTAQLLLAFVQAAGRPAYVAWGYLLQLPLFVAALIWVVPRHGAQGAAVVWAARMVLDALWLQGAAERAVPAARSARRTLLALNAASTLLVLASVLLARALGAG